MFSTQRKTAKKIAQHDRWIQEVAAEEARKAAEALARSGESLEDFEQDRRCAEELMLHELRQIGYEKLEIESRMFTALRQRCGDELALEFLKQIDFKGQDEKALMNALIGILQHPDLGRGRDVRQQWDDFVEPYRDKSEEIKVALRVRIEKAEQRTAREVQLREQEARVNALLRARIAEFEAAQERRGEHSAKRPAEPGDGHPDEAKRGREADERPPSPKLG
ncbi:MAG: hypothetical protein A3H43_03615 [Gammaproteobacteria bacterium RIFCSPLOWO2_02_FULL_42_9]|nr:MAG: hypothetical protein A3H43_03615 [Gammaproteobacteria bacterium RIFCSPLOWO2_02_FULL_42_9]